MPNPLTATVSDGTQQRSFEVLAPPAPLDPSRPLSLTIVFHGADGSPAQSEQWGFQDAADPPARGLFLFPQGIAGPADAGVGWNEFPCASYDFAFFDALVEWAASHYCIDTKRIFVAGFSWGGDMAAGLACCRGNAIRAIAASSCSDDFAVAGDLTTFKALPCPVASSAAIRFTHDASGADPAYPAPYFATTSALLRSLNGCGAGATTEGACTRYQGCRPGADVFECKYEGLGHRPPQRWAEETIAFFRDASTSH